MKKVMRSTTRTTRKRYHHGDLRQALLHAAREMLEEQGPSSLGLREIARRLGVSAPSAYHHFKSLGDIAVALVEQGARELSTKLGAVPNGNGLLSRTGEAYVEFASKNPALYRLMFGEGLTEETRRNTAMIDLRNTAFHIIRSRLENHVSPADLNSGALFLWSLVHGASLLLIDRQFDTGNRKLAIRRVLQFAGKGIGLKLTSMQ
jgi:AcrR family transcriptional regulator